MSYYTVTDEKVKMKEGEISEITLIHNNVEGGTAFVVFNVEDGVATIDSYSPMRSKKPFVKVSSEGGINERIVSSLFSKNETMMSSMEDTKTLLATAVHHVDENYDVSVQKHIPIGALERER